jgi:hypothetical protein
MVRRSRLRRDRASGDPTDIAAEYPSGAREPFVGSGGADGLPLPHSRPSYKRTSPPLVELAEDWLTAKRAL